MSEPSLPLGEPRRPANASMHKALASPVRTRIMSLLRSHQEFLDVARLADELDLHHNTVRTHLGILEGAGLVTSRPQPREGPGRPRHAYGPTDRAATVSDGDGYRFLAQILTSFFAASMDSPEDAGERTGAAWGRWLVDAPAPFAAADADAAMQQVVGLLDEVGFAPELDQSEPTRPRLLLHRCPFLDLARQHQEVVCSIHLGLMRGALDELGGDVEVEDLRAFVEPSLCISHLQLST